MGSIFAKQMKVVILNKSDSTGGAAVVSRRLMEALRREGVDARMLVCEKLTDSPFVEVAGNRKTIKNKFLLERLKIFLNNGFNRNTLFKIDTASDGLPLWKHPRIKEADAILLNWVNQGMLSLKGIKKLLELKKPVIWTMHDMWCFTGICHHAATCGNYRNSCGECILLGKKKSPRDLSNKIWKKKNGIYGNSGSFPNLAFVAVSSWLKKKAEESSLLKRHEVELIPNAFNNSSSGEREKRNKVRILMGAARLDDPIKGLETLKESTRIIKKEYPEISENMEIMMFGNIKDETLLEAFSLPVHQLGILKGEEAVKNAYEQAEIVVSASSYETLPGTLVEAQAYGCIPVSFDRGGQRDIIEDNSTGFIAQFNDDIYVRARNLAKEIVRAYEIIKNPRRLEDFRERMKKSIEDKFSYPRVANKYISLIEGLRSHQNGT